MSERFILISGCSGGGKTSLVEALGALGLETVPEPGRRIVAGELAADGRALPWVDPYAFARRAVELAEADLRCAEGKDGFVFFDRGLIDAAVAFGHAGGTPYRAVLGDTRRYAKRVFLAPPWPDIYVTDAERRHSRAEAEAEYRRLVQAFCDLGHDTRELPKTSLRDRVAFVLDDLGLSGTG